MRYKVLDQLKARELLDRMDPPHNERPTITGLKSAGTGEPLDEGRVEEIKSQLMALKDQHADNTQAFDAAACVVIHEVLPDERDLLSDDGFWRWLALGPLQEVVLWRFPPGKGRINGTGDAAPKLNRENFGVGASARQRSECFPYKLWLRAELGRVNGEGDLYRFAKRGDVDFWTSHVLRQTYTTNRALCRALARFQFPDELAGRPRLLSGTEKVDEGRLGIRTLAKRIKRLQATCELSILEESELEALISELAQDLTPAR